MGCPKGHTHDFLYIDTMTKLMAFFVQAYKTVVLVL